jgi:hypothetical protein
MAGIYAIVNTLEPVQLPYGPECPSALAAITHRCYIGKATNFESRWDKGHVQYLLNGQHCCTQLLDAFQGWLRDDRSRLELLQRSKQMFRSTWLVRSTQGRKPEWTLGPLEFRVLEEVRKDLLTETERRYHPPNVGGYRGGANDGCRWKKWDGK